VTVKQLSPLSKLEEMTRKLRGCGYRILCTLFPMVRYLPMLNFDGVIEIHPKMHAKWEDEQYTLDLPPMIVSLCLTLPGINHKMAAPFKRQKPSV